jgi:hypothetical protein
MYNEVPSFKAGEGTSEIALNCVARLVNRLQVPRLY